MTDRQDAESVAWSGIAVMLAEALKGLYDLCPEGFAYMPADLALEIYRRQSDGLDDAGKLGS